MPETGGAEASGFAHSIHDCFCLAAAVLRHSVVIMADHRFAAKVTAHAPVAVRIELLGRTST